MEFSIGDFAKFVTAEIVAKRLPAAQAVALEIGAKIIQAEAKRVIGTYDYGWPQLAESTQADREAEGFPANEPLLRTGEMRDSIEYTVHADVGEADIGSNSDIAVWQELGTSNIPPRPFLAGAAAHKGDEVAKLIGEVMVAAMAPASMASIEAEIARLALDALRHLEHAGKEIVDWDEDEKQKK
jgi:hypothetical protein